MKAEELKLTHGNLVWLNDKKGNRQVTPFKYVMRENDFEPIELKSDWLYQLGFIKQPLDDENNIDFKKGIFSIQYHTEVNDYICLNTMPTFTRIKYVHELQNIYFYLVGKLL